MICNMQGKPTDTPIFEKVGWTGDFNGAIKTFNYNFDTANFTAQFMQNIRDTAYANGRLNEYSPSGQKAPSESPTWVQVYVNAIYEAWKSSGQLSLTREHYEYMCTHADYWIREINKEAPWIWEWRGRLGDWAVTKEYLSYLDVLVDGPFIEAQKNLNLRFRGSENQRLIDVPASLQARKVILWEDKGMHV